MNMQPLVSVHLLADFLTPMLPWWGWLTVAVIPPAIILLYFLKLRRNPVEVPSTFLWRRMIEDLHVNSLWQRLRQNLLLFLQLLLLLLIVLACLHPGFSGSSLSGDRFILLIDNSASMSTVEGGATRLDTAKAKALEVINKMKSGDSAMIISFSDSTTIVQSYTDNHNTLQRKVGTIQPTAHATDMSDALRYAASLANPGRTGEESEGDVAVAKALPATLYIISDGGFRSIPDITLANLATKYLPVGEAENNVGIVVFTADANPEKRGELQAFARLENSGSEPVTLNVEMYVDDRKEPDDVVELTVPAAGTRGPGSVGAKFDLTELAIEEGDQTSLRVVINHNDSLKIDNTAYVALNRPRLAKILLVTASNPLMKHALNTSKIREISDVLLVEPKALTTKHYEDEALSGVYDLIIYDRCAPPKMPLANTMFIGAIPPGDLWKATDRQRILQIQDWNQVHPLMQSVDFAGVKFFEGRSISAPAGSIELASADIGPIAAISPRGGYLDAVFGVEILSREKDRNLFNTNWHLKETFPLFIQNMVKFLGGARQGANVISAKPGELVKLRTDGPVEFLRVANPAGSSLKVLPENQNTFVYGQTDDLGVYKARQPTGAGIYRQFSVNLFDGRESDIRTRPELELGLETVAGVQTWQPTRKSWWKWILLAGLGVLLFEWYIFNRRVYL